MLSFRTTLLGLVALALLGGGTLMYRAWPGVSDLVGSISAKQEICSTMDDSERMDLVGVETPTKLLNIEGSLDEYTCRWATKDTSATIFVQAVSAPADEWLDEVRAAATPQALGADPKRARQVLEALSEPSSTPEDACRVARLIFQMSGASDRAKRIVSPMASGDGTPAMLAQSCVAGTYSAVMVTAPGLVLDRPLARKTAQALRTVEGRVS